MNVVSQSKYDRLVDTLWLHDHFYRYVVRVFMLKVLKDKRIAKKIGLTKTLLDVGDDIFGVKD